MIGEINKEKESFRFFSKDKSPKLRLIDFEFLENPLSVIRSNVSVYPLSIGSSSCSKWAARFLKQSYVYPLSIGSSSYSKWVARFHYANPYQLKKKERGDIR